jgi:hypothetical protein
MSPAYRSAVLGALFVFLVSNPSYAGKDQNLEKNYGLIFGTAYGPDDHPLYGVKVEVHPLGKKSPHWELFSDHRGEFAQRVPPGPADYVVDGIVEVAPIENGAPKTHKKKRLKAEVKVHIEREERQDISLHLTE